ncbi:MAG: phage repressor protein [Allobaculum sp.]|nr:phage repressor protein [Allobaculum sp.]
MDYQLKTENWNGNDIRFINLDGKWWAVLKDVCDALGLKTFEVSRQLREFQERREKGMGSTHTLSESKKLIDKATVQTAGGPQEMLLVSEKGIYKSFFKSRKQKAEEFQDWVFDVLVELRSKSGLEGFQVFRMADKEHQKYMMGRIKEDLAPVGKREYIKANTIADKAVSTMFGFPKMLKKGQMNPEMLVARQPILEDTVKLMGIQNEYNLDFSVAKKIYEKWT